jgi:surface protein
MRYMFHAASKFDGDLASWNVERVVDMFGMFYQATSFRGDLSSWNTARVTDMSHMFREATAFRGSSLSSWDISQVAAFDLMLQDATSFAQSLCWDIPDSATTTDMFLDAHPAASAKAFNTTTLRTAVTAWCNDSTAATAAANYGNISAWCTEGVEDMSGLFGKTYADAMYRPLYCSTFATFNEDISRWNTSSVTTLANTFMGARLFNQDISGWQGELSSPPYVLWSYWCLFEITMQ